ncbi:MAG: zinc ribbon domain-containing protein [Rivularia sp. (in: cyanobacteria)]
MCPNCQTETVKKTLDVRVHECNNCGYTTDRDVAAAQVVQLRGLAAVGHTVKMQCVGKNNSFPVNEESASMNEGRVLKVREPRVSRNRK